MSRLQVNYKFVCMHHLKNNKTKQKNSSNIYIYIFFEFSVVASGNKYLGKIRRQLVTILKRQHFTTSRVSNGAG